MSSTQEVGDIFGAGKGPAQAMLRSPTVLIVSVGLWGMNIFFFRLFGINFKYVLKYDLMMEQQQQQDEQENNSSNIVVGSREETEDDEEEDYFDDSEERSGGAITWCRLVTFSISLVFLLHITTHYWMDHLERGVIGAVLFFYFTMIASIFLPIKSNQWLRRAFVIVLQRSFELINPRCWCLSLDAGQIPRPIPFVDVFYADAMCSLSKVFFDWGMLLHMASHYPDPVPQSAHNILIPSAFAALPFIIRARQCLIMHTVGKLKKDPKRGQHLANALKYSTSLFPLFLSAYQKVVDASTAKDLEGTLILLLTINACYALYWDIVMDWGMMQNPTAVVSNACIGGLHPPGKQPPSCHHSLLRPTLRFGLTMSALIMVADTFLRFSWTLRFVSKFPSNDAFVLCTQFLEVFRRAIWNLLRVEWENIKQKAKKPKARDSLSDNEDEEMTSFLPKTTTLSPRDSIGNGPTSQHTTTKPVNTNLVARV